MNTLTYVTHTTVQHRRAANTLASTPFARPAGAKPSPASTAQPYTTTASVIAHRHPRAVRSAVPGSRVRRSGCSAKLLTKARQLGLYSGAIFRAQLGASTAQGLPRRAVAGPPLFCGEMASTWPLPQTPLKHALAPSPILSGTWFATSARLHVTAPHAALHTSAVVQIVRQFHEAQSLTCAGSTRVRPCDRSVVRRSARCSGRF